MKLSAFPPVLRSPARLALLAVALWFLVTSFVRLPLVSLDAVLPQTMWQLPHLVRLPVTFAFIGLTLWQWWRMRQGGAVPQRALWVSLLVLTIICCRWNTLAGFERGDPDESEDITAARSLLLDNRFWISVDTATHGPLVSLWHTVLPRIGLAIDYGSAHLMGILMLATSVVCGYLLLRRVATEANARLLTLPLVFAVAALTLPDLTAYNGEHPILFLGMIGAACAVSALYPPLDAPEAHVQRNVFLRLLIAGACIAGISWAKNQGVPITAALAAAVAIACWRAPVEADDRTAHRRTRSRRLLWLAIGFLLPAFAIMTWTLASGAFLPMVRSYFQWNIAYATRFKDLNSLPTTIKTTRWAVPTFVQMSRFTTVFHLAAVVGWVALLFQLARKNASFWGHGPLPGLLLSCLAVAGAAWLCAIKPGIEYQHYLMLPLLPTFLIYLLAWVPLLKSGTAHPAREATTASARPLPVRANGGALAGAALVLLGIALPVGAWGFLRGPQGGGGQLVIPMVFLPMDSADIVARTRALTGPDDEVALWGWMPSIYVNTNRRPATRTRTCMREAIASLDLQPYFLGLWVSDLDKSQPVVFIDEVHARSAQIANARPSRLLWMYGEMAQRISDLPRLEDVDFRHEGYPALASRVAERYRLMYISPDGTRLYVRNDRASDAARRLATFTP